MSFLVHEDGFQLVRGERGEQPFGDDYPGVTHTGQAVCDRDRMVQNAEPTTSAGLFTVVVTGEVDQMAVTAPLPQGPGCA